MEMQLNETCVYSDHDKANLFNEYFKSVFTTESCILPDLDTIPCPLNYIDNIEFSEEEVFEALTCLDPNKAMGIDMISTKILKYCATAFVQPFHHLFTLTLSHEMLPFDWKTHIIIPVFKSGNKNQVNNYRPISLLCITSKVLERLIYNKLIDHVINFISPFQFGFLRGRSCTQQLLLFLNNVSVQMCS